MQEDILVVGAAIAAFAVALPFLWKYFQPVPGEENLFDAAKANGFELANDGRAWLRSQLPRLHVNTVTRYDPVRNRRREQGADEVPLRIAKHDDADFTTVLFFRDEFVAMQAAGDRLVVALNPKDSAVLPPLGDGVRDRVRRDTGWIVEVHGGWLVMIREAAEPIEPDRFAELLDGAHGAFQSATRPQPVGV